MVLLSILITLFSPLTRFAYAQGGASPRVFLPLLGRGYVPPAVPQASPRPASPASPTPSATATVPAAALPTRGILPDEQGVPVVISASPAPAPAFQLYTVQKGDTVSGIARLFGVNQQELLDANPELRDHPDSLRVGQELRIPKAGQVSDEPVRAAPAVAAVATPIGVPTPPLPSHATPLGEDLNP